MPVRAVPHQIGDRLLIEVEVPSAAVTSLDGDLAGVTLDAEDWVQVGKDVSRARQAAERVTDGEALARRLSRVLQQAAIDGMRGWVDPVQARRRAVSRVLHHLGDMVVAGTLVEVAVGWMTPVGTPTMVVRYRPRGGALVEETIRLDVPDPSATVAP